MSDRDGLPNGDGGPAFPQTNLLNRDGHPMQEWQPGMSLRDYFAAAALQGLLANSGGPIQANQMNGWAYSNCDEDGVATLCYTLADALLHARSQRGKG